MPSLAALFQAGGERFRLGGAAAAQADVPAAEGEPEPPPRGPRDADADGGGAAADAETAPAEGADAAARPAGEGGAADADSASPPPAGAGKKKKKKPKRADAEAAAPADAADVIAAVSDFVGAASRAQQAADAPADARGGSPGSQGFVTPDSDAPPKEGGFRDALPDAGSDSDDEDAQLPGAPGSAAAAAKRKKKKKKKPATGAAAGTQAPETSSSAPASSSSAPSGPSAASSAPPSSSSSAPASSSSASKSGKPPAPAATGPRPDPAPAEKLRSRREQLQQRRTARIPIIRTQPAKSASFSSQASSSAGGNGSGAGKDDAAPNLSRDQADAIMSYTSQVFFHNYLRQVVGVGGAAGISVVQQRGSDDEREGHPSRKRREDADVERRRDIVDQIKKLKGSDWEPVQAAPLARMKYSTLQTAGEVMIQVNLPGVKEDEVVVGWHGDKQVELSFPTVQFHPDEPTALSLALYGAVVPKNTKIECKPKHVQVTLRKAKVGQWERIEGQRRDRKAENGGEAQAAPGTEAAEEARGRGGAAGADIDEIVREIEGRAGGGQAAPRPDKRSASVGKPAKEKEGPPAVRTASGTELPSEAGQAMPGSWVEAPAYSWPELEGAPDGVEQGGEEVGELAPAARRSYAPAGLFNMGQTCYMNSILQALVSIPDVGRYFIDNDYTNDINATNPLGHKGEMANAFAAVVKQLLTPGAASFTPKAFLSTLRQLWYNLQDEYQQHDAHELMSFLLDAVHEDLNRVQDRKKVPQLEEKDDEPDHLAARRFWEHHSMLNDSEIVRLFQGLYRSAVECKNCKKRSVKFDPFMYMTVSLPEERIQVRVSSVSITGQKTVHPAQSFPKEAKFDDVRKRIGQNNAVVCALSDDGTMVRTAYKSENRISSIYNEHGPPGPLDVFVYEIEPDSAFIAVHHVATGSRTSAFGERFGSALVLSVPPGTYTRAELYRVLLEKLKIYGVLPADFDDATDPPPFLVRAHKNNGPASPTSSDEEGSETRRRSTEEAEQLGLAEPEGPFVTLQPTKFERIVLDWRADAKNHYYRDRGFKSDSDSDDEDARSASSPSKQKPNGILHSPSRPNGVRGGSADGAVQQPPITLEDCIHMFSAPEDLDEDSWTCQRCKRKGMATKRLNLYTLPDVFIVHIKRFRWLDNPGGFSYNKKIDVHVDFPMEMDLSKHALGVKGPAQYRLFAVVNHFGSTFSGHYTTFCDRSGIQELFPDAADGEAASGTSSGDRQPAWFEFDDEAVKKMSESEVKTKWAYLLFYRRLNSDREPAKAVSSETLLAE